MAPRRPVSIVLVSCVAFVRHFVQRRYGRGQSGGQVRDDRRVTYDPARDARRGADVVDAPAPAPAVVDEPAAEAVSGAKKRLRDDDDDEESEDD